MKYLLVSLSLILASALCVSAQRSYKPSISILGDSYSTYEGFMHPDSNLVWYHIVESDPMRTDVQSATQTWWHKFISDNGLKLCVNNSFSGSTICYTGYKDKKTGLPADYTNRSFVNRVKYLGNPDIILIFGGTNDDWAKSPIGDYKYSDWTANDLRSFRPAMAAMLQKAKQLYPNVDIIFILNSDLKQVVDESVLTICKHYGISCLELTNIDKRQGHPSIKGMQQINQQLTAHLKSLGLLP